MYAMHSYHWQYFTGQSISVLHVNMEKLKCAFCVTCICVQNIFSCDNVMFTNPIMKGFGY